MLLKALQHGHRESEVFCGVCVTTGGSGTQVELPGSQRGEEIYVHATEAKWFSFQERHTDSSF